MTGWLRSRRRALRHTRILAADVSHGRMTPVSRKGGNVSWDHAPAPLIMSSVSCKSHSTLTWLERKRKTQGAPVKREPMVKTFSLQTKERSLTSDVREEDKGVRPRL